MKKVTYVAVMTAMVILALTTTTYANPNAQVERVVRAYFRDLPVMVNIAKCESGFEHFDPSGPNGLNTNPDPRSSASGVFQILLKTHGPKAHRLGLDITTVAGQLGYARHLYKRGGTSDWKASKACWRHAK